MRRLTAICLIALSCGQTAYARPAWYRDWKVWTVVGLNIASGFAAEHYASRCRHINGIAPCPGGYGAIAARTALTWTLVGTTSALSVYGRHAEYKEWFAPAGVTITINGITAYQAGTKHCPHGEYFLPGTRSTCIPQESDYK